MCTEGFIYYLNINCWGKPTKTLIIINIAFDKHELNLQGMAFVELLNICKVLHDS